MRIILAALLIPIAFANNGERDGAPIEPSSLGAAAGAIASSEFPGTPREAAIERLKQLAVRRQSPGAVPPWRSVEEALDSLEFALSASASQAASMGGEGTPGGARLDAGLLALVLQDLAIGTDARERDHLAGRTAAIASMVESSLGSRLLLRALARIIEPSVLPVDAPRADHDALSERAGKALDRIVDLLTDPLAIGPPQFVVTTLLRVELLRSGARMPSFTARDAAGNELRSAELLGKVTVLRFWDPTSPASVAAHEADAEFVRSFWDAPFELVGVAKSADRAEYLEFVAERSFAGLQLFDGPISVELADALAKDAGRVVSGGAQRAPMGASTAWMRPTPGAVFVIDASGTLRGRDLSHDGLEALVSALVAEENARRREESLAALRSR